MQLPYDRNCTGNCIFKKVQNMKKNIGITFLVLFFLVIGLTGCGKKELGDTYIEGSDYQYMYMGDDNLYMHQARGRNGYFFLQGHYIYYLDDATQKLVPLCNKADCLHDQETEADRYSECNAYVDMSGIVWVGIAYCNGYLYYIEAGAEDGFYQTLYRMKEDGSEREKLYQWDGMSVEQWCVHRDVLYYVEHTYTTEADAQGISQSVEHYAVKSLSLKGNKKPSTIYEPEAGLTIYTLGTLQAYGNHVYFMNNAVTTLDTDQITDDNYMDYMYFKYMTYDITTGTVSELTIPDMEKGEIVQNITFWQNKLILQPVDSNQELDYVNTVYLADLDGSNAEVFMENIPQGTQFISDGQYLYLSNSSLVSSGYGETQQYQVYDANLKLVDTLGMPSESFFHPEMSFLNFLDPEIGPADGMYMFLKKEDGSGAELSYFDKSTIGTYHGETIQYTKIADWTCPSADSDLMQREEE